MAAMLADIGHGDEVIIPSYTFVSTANAFVLRGGVPVFIDIHPEALNIDENLIEEAITDKTKAIVVVHYAGVACEMDTIMTIAEKHGLLVIEDALSKCGSMGIAIPGGAFFLVDENGVTIEESEKVGELVYRGENVSLGYADCREDLAKGDELGGLLFTGDLARRDEDGFYYITGRKKRFIKLFGNRVNLGEAEQMIKELVSDCACCGSDDHILIYVTEPGMENEVRHCISGRLGIHHSAFTFKVIDEIPNNEAGKTLYAGFQP